MKIYFYLFIFKKIENIVVPRYSNNIFLFL